LGKVPFSQETQAFPWGKFIAPQGSCFFFHGTFYSLCKLFFEVFHLFFKKFFCSLGISFCSMGNWHHKLTKFYKFIWIPCKIRFS
jgi:hypothetical protein